MKRLLVCAAVVALAACSEAPEADTTEDTAAAESTEAAPVVAAEHAAGKYEYTDGDYNGTYETKADGTYTGSTPDGEMKGTWTQEGDRTCFDPDGDGENLGEECWIRSAANADGSFTAVSQTDGRTVTVRVPAG